MDENQDPSMYMTYTPTPGEDKQSLDSLANNFYDDYKLKKTLRANGIYDRTDFDDWSSFYIFPRNDPYQMLGTTREYIFITKPDLHIFRSKNADRSSKNELNEEIAQEPFFAMLRDMGYTDLLMNLQLSSSPTDCFIPIFSNYKTSTVNLNEITSEDIESAANMWGTKLSYRASSTGSDEYTDFSLEFKDNRYLDCYLWFKAYDLYMRRKTEGLISPVDQNYVVYKIDPSQMTLFKIVVGEDGETIVYWACIWGCYPKSVPRETFSDLPLDGQLKFTVNWHGSFQDDMNPNIISHFNSLCARKLGGKVYEATYTNDASQKYRTYYKSASGNYKEISLYDPEIFQVTGESAVIPYIVYTPQDSKVVGANAKYGHYSLKWFQAVN